MSIDERYAKMENLLDWFIGIITLVGIALAVAIVVIIANA